MKNIIMPPEMNPGVYHVVQKRLTVLFLFSRGLMSQATVFNQTGRDPPLFEYYGKFKYNSFGRIPF